MIQHSILEQLFGLLLMGALLYFGYTNFKNNPELFSMENTNKAIWKMGILALILMAFVYFLIQMVGTGDYYENSTPL